MIALNTSKQTLTTSYFQTINTIKNLDSRSVSTERLYKYSFLYLIHLYFWENYKVKTYRKQSLVTSQMTGKVIILISRETGPIDIRLVSSLIYSNYCIWICIYNIQYMHAYTNWQCVDKGSYQVFFFFFKDYSSSTFRIKYKWKYNSILYTKRMCIYIYVYIYNTLYIYSYHHRIYDSLIYTLRNKRLGRVQLYYKLHR